MTSAEYLEAIRRDDTRAITRALLMARLLELRSELLPAPAPVPEQEDGNAGGEEQRPTERVDRI